MIGFQRGINLIFPKKEGDNMLFPPLRSENDLFIKEIFIIYTTLNFKTP